MDFLILARDCAKDLKDQGDYDSLYLFADWAAHSNIDYKHQLKVLKGLSMLMDDNLWTQEERECPIFCVTTLWSMLPERSKDDDDFQGIAGRVAEGLRAA